MKKEREKKQVLRHYIVNYIMGSEVDNLPKF